MEINAAYMCVNLSIVMNAYKYRNFHSGGGSITITLGWMTTTLKRLPMLYIIKSQWPLLMYVYLQLINIDAIRSIH